MASAKPDTELVYGQNDVPPAGHLILLSLQQGMLLILGTMLPVLLVKEFGGSTEMAITMVSLTMIISGVGTIIQAVRLRWIGSGYLCPNIGGPSYLALSITAVIQGGLPLMQGMLVFAGIIEMFLSRVVSRLRSLFPPLVVGMTVMMVGVSIIPMAFSNFCGSPVAGDEVIWQDIAVGCVTLMVIVGCNLWGKGQVKLYCLLIGIFVGWGVALCISPFDPVQYQMLGEVPVFAIPFKGLSQFRLAFDWSLALPFLVISICGSLKSFGNLLAAQKITRPDLEKPDMKPIAGGLMADGLSTAMAGLIGAVAVDTSSSNVGLAAATRAVSRWIGVCVVNK
ncbi:MAG: solute carrier family 23 protein [Syntrophales bacterium]|nr:solute carrier family 23 protein [Syntrophales bacterium]